MTNLAMQQGGAAGAAPAQPLPPNMQQAVDLATQVQAQIEAAQAAAAQGQAAAQAGAQSQPTITIPGDEGVIIIRDPQTGETVEIQRDAIPTWIQDGPPEGVFMIPIALFASLAFVIVGLPIARAFARRMDSRNAAPPALGASPELRQLQTSIDTMAVEIERMSEHQRFLTRVLSEGRPAEAAPVPPARDASGAVPR